MLKGWIEAEAVVNDVQHDLDAVGFQTPMKTRWRT
jgi:hypothetical protein